MSIQAITALNEAVTALQSTTAALQDAVAAVDLRLSALERAAAQKRSPGAWATWTDDDLAQIAQHLAAHGPQPKASLARSYGRAMLAEGIDREFFFESSRGGARILSASPTARGTTAGRIIDYLATNGPTWLNSDHPNHPPLRDRFDRNRLPRDLDEAVATGQVVKGKGASTGGRPPSIYAIRPPLDGPDLPQIVDGVPVTWQT